MCVCGAAALLRMAETRALARARSAVVAAADDVERARAATPRHGGASSGRQHAASPSPPRRMPTRSLAAGRSRAAADDDDGDSEAKTAVGEEDDDELQATMDAFAEHGIDESNSESDGEQLARGMATVDLDDEPEDGKAERKSSRPAVRGRTAAAPATRKRRRGREVVGLDTGPHLLARYDNEGEYACDLCGAEEIVGWNCYVHGGECCYFQCESCHDANEEDAAAATDAVWTRRLTDTPPFAFTGPDPGPHGIDTADPLTLFRLFVSAAMMDGIVAATNVYASNKFSERKVIHTHCEHDLPAQILSRSHRQKEVHTSVTAFIPSFFAQLFHLVLPIGLFKHHDCQDRMSTCMV